VVVLVQGVLRLVKFQSFVGDLENLTMAASQQYLAKYREMSKASDSEDYAGDP
jgi:hypothetical protein